MTISLNHTHFSVFYLQSIVGVNSNDLVFLKTKLTPKKIVLIDGHRFWALTIPKHESADS